MKVFFTALLLPRVARCYDLVNGYVSVFDDREKVWHTSYLSFNAERGPKGPRGALLLTGEQQASDLCFFVQPSKRQKAI